MKWRWMALLLAALLSTAACKRTENKPDVKEEDLDLDLDTGVDADPSEISRDDDKPATEGESSEKPENANDDAAP